MDVPVVETQRLRLREWRYEDIDALAEIYAFPQVHEMLVPMTREQTEEQVVYFAAFWERFGYGLWAVEERSTGRFLGRIGLITHPDFEPEPEHTEVGWTLHPSVWGRGLAAEGGAAAIRFGFQTLGLERIISITRPNNAASRRVMEKLGLTYQGSTVWRGIDHVWYAIDRVG